MVVDPSPWGGNPLVVEYQREGAGCQLLLSLWVYRENSLVAISIIPSQHWPQLQSSLQRLLKGKCLLKMILMMMEMNGREPGRVPSW